MEAGDFIFFLIDLNMINLDPYLWQCMDLGTCCTNSFKAFEINDHLNIFDPR